MSAEVWVHKKDLARAEEVLRQGQRIERDPAEEIGS